MGRCQAGSCFPMLIRKWGSVYGLYYGLSKLQMGYNHSLTWIHHVVLGIFETHQPASWQHQQRLAKIVVWTLALERRKSVAPRFSGDAWSLRLESKIWGFGRAALHTSPLVYPLCREPFGNICASCCFFFLRSLPGNSRWEVHQQWYYLWLWLMSSISSKYASI